MRNGWINPEERLPEDGEEVLALVSGVIGNIALLNAYMLAGYYKNEGFILEEYPNAEGISIEWWMPLLEPPKGVIQV